MFIVKWFVPMTVVWLHKMNKLPRNKRIENDFEFNDLVQSLCIKTLKSVRSMSVLSCTIIIMKTVKDISFPIFNNVNSLI